MKDTVLSKMRHNRGEIEKFKNLLSQNRDNIKYHDDLYYKKALPVISDYEYDKLVERYNKMLSNFSDIVDTVYTTHQAFVELTLPHSIEFNDDEIKEIKEFYKYIRNYKYKILPSLELKVGSSITEDYAKKKHDKPMLSLSNSYSEVDVKSFIETTYDALVKYVGNDIHKIGVFTAEDKVDGLSCSIKYSSGELVEALTRGDGETGEIITSKVREMNEVPEILKGKLTGLTVEIRGEIVLTHKAFEEINARSGDLYKNQRNAAAGIVRTKSNDLASYLTFIAYDIIYNDVHNYETINSHIEDIETLKSSGFKVVNIYPLISIEDYCDNTRWKNVQTRILDVVNMLKQKNRENGEYLIDGAVIKYNNSAHYDILGRTAKFPKYATAFKYKDDVYVTTIEGITWQVGRTGRVTPVAEVSPVEIDGTTVTRATLHNLEQMVRLGNVKVGKSVEIIKSAAVIPKIIRVVDHFIDDVTTTDINYDSIEHPKFCPSCNHKLIIDGPELVCTNENCRDKIIQSISFFVGREYMNIVGLSDGIITKLFDLGFIKNVADLYTLKNHRAELIKIPGYGETSIDKLLKNIELSKKNDVYRLIAALGFKSVGKTVSKILTDNYDSLDKLKDVKRDDIIKLNGIGPITVDDVMSFIKSIPNIITTFVNGLGLNGSSEKKTLLNTSLKNEVFVLTGKFLDKTRKELEHEITIRGGKTTSSVSNNVTYVVAGQDATQHKVSKAESLGIKVITEHNLIDLLGI